MAKRTKVPCPRPLNCLKAAFVGVGDGGGAVGATAATPALMASRHNMTKWRATADADAENFGELSAGDTAEEEGETSAGHGASQQQDGERRRRRRGRRGGRRNRMDRDHNGGSNWQDRDSLESQPAPTTAEDFSAAPAPEPNFSEAAADHDAAVPDTPAPAFSEQPAAEPHASPAPAPAEEPAPRRRSTVREPAPTASNAEPAHSPAAPAPTAAPEPVITEIGDEESAEQPRRRGWWSRRFAGG